ncbi:hypothetical protein [Paenibacillus silviterrae]|uniref:hypothetical protein n=1 Tax=Paenibacillus silviterrae TaxID=3242194 RepID=UPI002542A14A|nr:hypothetical protein [Paenibacillus chinjuensis]
MTTRSKLLQHTLLAIALAAVISGCQSNKAPEAAEGTPPKASTPAETPGQTTPPGQAAQPGGTGTTQPGTGQAQPAQPAQPAAPVKLTPITYQDVDKQSLTEIAKLVNLKTIYLPQQGAMDDKIDQMGTTGDGHLVVTYYKMQVTLSTKALEPEGDKGTPVQLKNGKATWHTPNGQPTLYLKQGDTNIALSSAKGLTQADLQAIAETIAPLK